VEIFLVGIDRLRKPSPEKVKAGARRDARWIGDTKEEHHDAASEPSIIALRRPTVRSYSTPVPASRFTRGWRDGRVEVDET
jgi:hypothetical protein